VGKVENPAGGCFNVITYERRPSVVLTNKGFLPLMDERTKGYGEKSSLHMSPSFVQTSTAEDWKKPPPLAMGSGGERRPRRGET
jgi:hypothetical protein